MLNFDDYGESETVCNLILSFATKISPCAISVLANRASTADLLRLKQQFGGQINLHVDLVEGPFLCRTKPLTVSEISREIEAQLSVLTRNEITPKTIDFHQNKHKNIRVLVALVTLAPKLNQYSIRPIMQSLLMRPSIYLAIKNMGALFLQSAVNNWIQFNKGPVLSGLDNFPSHRWEELKFFLSSESHIVPCHPHIYANERKFCEWMLGS